MEFYTSVIHTDNISNWEKVEYKESQAIKF